MRLLQSVDAQRASRAHAWMNASAFLLAAYCEEIRRSPNRSIPIRIPPMTTPTDPKIHSAWRLGDQAGLAHYIDRKTKSPQPSCATKVAIEVV
jgi:hypothetical protein